MFFLAGITVAVEGELRLRYVLDATSERKVVVDLEDRQIAAGVQTMHNPYIAKMVFDVPTICISINWYLRGRMDSSVRICHAFQPNGN